METERQFPPLGAEPSQGQPRWGWAGSDMRRLKPADTHGWRVPGPRPLENAHGEWLGEKNLAWS